MSGKQSSLLFVELMQRVPKDQMANLKQFVAKNTEYRKRVNKYPERLPTIDWNYYRANVRPEAVNLVDEFEKKYEELNKTFDSRHELDLSKYYVELEKQRAEVEEEVNNFKEKSDERICELEQKIESVKSMIPFEQMTMEEFIECCPEKAEMIPGYGKNLFWPFLPEEQEPGAPKRVGPHVLEEAKRAAEAKPGVAKTAKPIEPPKASDATKSEPSKPKTK